MSNSFRVKKELALTSIKAVDATVDSVRAETVVVSQVVNGNATSGPVTLGNSPPASVVVTPVALAAGYDIVGTYDSDGNPTDNRFVTFTLNDPTLVVDDQVIVSAAAPAISAPVAPIAVTVAGTVNIPVEFTEVAASGSYRVDLIINRIGA